MDWLVLAAPSLLLTLVILLPGWLLLTILGRRGPSGLTAAPAVSVGVVAFAALICEFSGLAWGWLPLVIATVLLAAASYAVRRWGGTPLTAPGGADDPTRRWAGPIAWAVGACVVGSLLLWVRHLTNVLPEPTSFSQTFDNVFHLNVIRYLGDTGQSGPWLPRNLDPTTGRTIFYPTTWHQLGALILPAAGGSVQVASNAVLFVTCALVWPLSTLELSLKVGVRTVGGLLSATVLAAAFSAYPFLMLDWGVLYPNLLAYAAVPAALALLAALLGAGPDRRQSLAPLALLTGVSALGVALAHPNGLLLLLVMALPALAEGIVRTVRLARAECVGWLWAAAWWAAAAVAVAALGRLWLFARPSNRPWAPLHDVPTAFGQALFGDLIMGPPNPIPAFLALFGFLLLALRARHVWFLASALIALTLWVVGSGASDGPVREFLTGAWYSDSYRLAPILVLVSVPAGAYAIDRALQWLRPAQAPRRATVDAAESLVTRSRRRILTAGVLIPALLVVTTQWSPAMHHAVTHARTAYDFADQQCADGDVTCLLTTDEFAVLESLPRLTHPGAVLLADPQTGGALAYAFADRHVLRPYIGADMSAAEQTLIDGLDASPGDPALCEALVESGVTHVLDFGLQTVHSTWITAPGLDELDGSPGVQPLMRRGSAVLYEVTAC